MYSVIKYKFTIAYMASIVLVFFGFLYLPLVVTVYEGAQISLWSLVVGAWFVLRDFSQRELGHYVFVPMTIGVALGAVFMPAVAIVAVLSSAASEISDWAVYTLTRKPFHQRILISSLVSAPIDTFVFFWAFDYFQVMPELNIFNWVSIAAGSASKLVAALVIYAYYTQKVRTP
jgi:uncharacterized PurR-regulated membrane protein YhhQ (DUF165 family)